MSKNNGEIPTTKSKIFTKVFTLFFCGALATSIGVGFLTYHLITLPSKATKVELVKVKGPEVLANKGDTMIFQASIKNPKGITTWKEPTPIPGVSYQYEEDGDTMIVTATSNLNNPAKIDLIVTNNDVSATKTISIKNIVYNKVPVTLAYFDLVDTDTVGDTIKGFSSSVIANPSILIDAGYNSLDFSSSAVKYVAGDANFAENVFNDWNALKIDLSGLIFQFSDDTINGYYCSGLDLFKNCNLDSCIELDLSNADFASYADIQYPNRDSTYTAYETFASFRLNNLYSINLKNTKFAYSSTNTNVYMNQIYTGYKTFENVYCPNIALLDLSNAIFAAENMGRSAGYFTANQTFMDGYFPSLQFLKMNGVVFAAENMMNLEPGDFPWGIRTADGTFENTNLNSVVNLDLSTTIFSAQDMSNSFDFENVYTATGTFRYSYMSNLISLNLNGVQFAHNSNAIYGYNSAHATFQNSFMCNLKNLNLNNTNFAAENMAKTDPGDDPIKTADSTFAAANLSGLTNLDLSTCTFVTQNMNIGGVSSAYQTFVNAVLTSLLKLDLSNIEFAVQNMCDDGIIETARSTFAGTNLSSVATLDLSNAKFSTSNMYRITNNPQKLELYTAYSTFERTVLSTLNYLNLSNTEFSSTTMMDSAVINSATVYILYYTFNAAEMSTLKALKLSDALIYSPDLLSASNYTIGFVAFGNAKLSNCIDIFLYKDGQYQTNIFNQPSSGNFLFPTTGTIHWEDYDASTSPTPSGWNSVMSRYPFTSWTWTNDMTGGNS
ncbi:MAG: hypothetical protein Ta2E_07970 [Mycoplasmoidaceae bacterium]|nr:MAG: hypothetical protein Ta2E_07970 [Mycoplasmoidaceae bacterium]